MRKLCLLLFLFSCLTVVQAQETSISLNGNYRTETKDWGIGVQFTTPIYKSLYIAPSVSYFFENEYRNNWSDGYVDIKGKSITYGVDLHYAFYLEGSLSFVSPFVGIEGETSWGESSGVTTFMGHSSRLGGDFTDSRMFGNIGIAGKWFVDGNFFINTQIKYSLSNDTEYSRFVFTGGLGYAF